MTTQEKIDLIKVLTEVVKANSGFWGSESLVDEVNEKIKKLLQDI